MQADERSINDRRALIVKSAPVIPLAGFGLIGVAVWQTLVAGGYFPLKRDVQAVVQIVTPDPLPADAAMVLMTTNPRGETFDIRQTVAGQSGSLYHSAKPLQDTVQADLWVGRGYTAIWIRPSVILAGSEPMDQDFQ